MQCRKSKPQAEAEAGQSLGAVGGPSAPQLAVAHGAGRGGVDQVHASATSNMPGQASSPGAWAKGLLLTPRMGKDWKQAHCTCNWCVHWVNRKVYCTGETYTGGKVAVQACRQGGFFGGWLQGSGRAQRACVQECGSDVAPACVGRKNEIAPVAHCICMRQSQLVSAAAAPPPPPQQPASRPPPPAAPAKPDEACLRPAAAHPWRRGCCTCPGSACGV